MKTFPARLMNELFRSHAFRLGVSFHGEAMTATTPTTTSDGATTAGRIDIPGLAIDDDDGGRPPYTFDERAMVEIGRAYGAFGRGPPGGRNGAPPYSVDVDRASTSSSRSGGGAEGGGGRRCVSGGNGNGATMEHFAFSAGIVAADGFAGVGDVGSLWMEGCQCVVDRDDDATDHDGWVGPNRADEEYPGGVCSYPSERTGRYDGSSLRSFVARVTAPPVDDDANVDEVAFFGTSSRHDPSKNPEADDFDDRPYALFDREALGANVRMSLLATELVEPYTSIRAIAGVLLRDDDIVPMTPRPPGGCGRTRSMMIPESPSMENTTITWTVGGALSVTETAIMYGKSNVLDRKIFDCVTQPVSGTSLDVSSSNAAA